MPYISNEKREVFDPPIMMLVDTFRKLGDDANVAGNLNYVITKLMVSLFPSPSYQRFNDMIGALECCKLELYRKKVAPYEEKKEQENGPV